MIEATRKLQMVLVDCSKSIPSDMAHYGVKGFPTILLCKPDGMMVENLQGRDPAGVAAQFTSFANTHSVAPNWESSIETGLTAAKEKKQNVLLFINDSSNPSAITFESFFSDPAVKTHLEKFVIVRQELSADSQICKTLKHKKGSAIYILDAASEKALQQPVKTIKVVKSAKKLAEKIIEAIGAAGSGAATPKPKEEPESTEEK